MLLRSPFTSAREPRAAFLFIKSRCLRGTNSERKYALCGLWHSLPPVCAVPVPCSSKDMESTLEVARRAVEADMAHNYPTAFQLYSQAATELEAFAASASSSRTPEEIAGAPALLD